MLYWKHRWIISNNYEKYKYVRSCHGPEQFERFLFIYLLTFK